MAKGQSTKVTKKPNYELPQEVKTIIIKKIAEVEAVTIKRRSDVEREIKELAKWLKSDDATTTITQGKSEDNSNVKKETQDALKKAAESLLKNAGIKADKETKEGIGVLPDSQDIQTSEVGDESK